MSDSSSRPPRALHLVSVRSTPDGSVEATTRSATPAPDVVHLLPAPPTAPAAYALEVLAAQAQHSGPIGEAAWGFFNEAGGPALTPWQAFRAGLELAARVAREGEL